ncbi:MAG: BCAM0308 family protein [Nitrospirota bacterium]|nr:BCAM0308 family protein [Nitrospirota bacterium]
MKKRITKTERGYDIVNKDPYLPRGASGKLAVCEGCQAVYMKKRWYLKVDAAKTAGVPVTKVVCPACLKIRDNFPGGIVTVSGDFVIARKEEFLHLVRNEEQRARGFNPLERVMSIKENGHGSIVINTTNEKLAQRIGRAMKKAFHGEVTYRWSHDDKLVRVDWVREAA